MLEKLLYLLFGALLTALGFLLRRRIEQKPTFEQIDKHQRLLELKQNLDASGATLDDLKRLEDLLLGKASAATTLAAAYEDQAIQIYAADGSAHMTQLDMNQHAADSFHRADQRLNAIVVSLKEVLSANDWEAFEASQQAWLQYRDKTANFQSGQYEGGSIQPLIHASSLESTTVARIVELEPLLRDIQIR